MKLADLVGRVHGVAGSVVLHRAGPCISASLVFSLVTCFEFVHLCISTMLGWSLSQRADPNRSCTSGVLPIFWSCLLSHPKVSSKTLSSGIKLGIHRLVVSHGCGQDSWDTRETTCHPQSQQTRHRDEAKMSLETTQLQIHQRVPDVGP